MTENHFNFEKEVLDASKKSPILVDFWAEWCGPCKILGPVLEKLAAEANGKWLLVKVNTEEFPELSMQYGIRGIPAVKLFSDGEIIAEFVGALPEVQVRRWLGENIPTETKKMLSEAKSKLASGDRKAAKVAFEKIIELEPANLDAAVNLALLVVLDEPKRAQELVKVVPIESEFYAAAESIQVFDHLVHNKDEIIASSDNSPAWLSYISGIEALRNKDYETALQQWIEAVAIDKTIDNDGPRKACISLFTILGQPHPLTQKYHRSFTSALF